MLLHCSVRRQKERGKENAREMGSFTILLLKLMVCIKFRFVDSCVNQLELGERKGECSKI